MKAASPVRIGLTSMLYALVLSEKEGDPETQGDHNAHHHSDRVCSLLDRCSRDSFLERFQ